MSQTSNNVGTSYPGTPAALNGIPSQLQTAQDNQLLIQGNSVFGSDALRNDIRLGIGVFASPINGVADRLHLNDITASDVYTRITNLTTGQTATDGFVSGIDANGDVLIQQFENLPMRLYTNSAERLRILANGNVGINNTSGNNRLEITSGTGNPYFSSGASSGLRFTNLTSSAVVTNTTTKVLSVDANGDVILATPVGAALVTAKNGLNTIAGNPDVELGGNLIRATTVDLNAFELVFNQTGRFGIGGSITVLNMSGPVSPMGANNAKIVFDNGGFEETQKIYAYAASGFTPSTLCGLNVETLNSVAGAVGTGAIGVKSAIRSDGTNTALLGNVSTSNSNAGTSKGLDAYAYNGEKVYGAYIYGTQDASYASNASSQLWGLQSTADGGYESRGVHGQSFNGIYNYAGYFDAEQVTQSGGLINKGIYSQATNGPAINLGVHGFGSSGSLYPNAASSIGVYGQASYGIEVIGVKGECPPNTSTGLAGSSINLAGLFVGDVMVTGTGYDAGFSVIFSDKSLKTNIRPMENALNIINGLSPKTYNLTNENCKQLDFTGKKTQYGLIAQEVEEVFPDIVYKTKVPAQLDDKGKVIHEQKEVKGVSYEELISVLVKATQEQQLQIAELSSQVKELNQKLDKTTQSSNKSGAGSTALGGSMVNLSDNHIVVLEQNVPNPFFESTVINYSLPLSYQTAKISFTNGEGKFIKEVDLSSIAGNSLTVYASNLTKGIYNYTLIVDGKVIDTKRMIKD